MQPPNPSEVSNPREGVSTHLRGLLERVKALSILAGRVPWLEIGAVLLMLALAIAARLSLIDFKSDDFYASLKPWYNTIRSEGFAAFGTDFSTYNPPYLYLLYLIARFLPNVSVVLAVKLPGLVSDFVCALFIYLLVAMRSERGRALPFAAGAITLFAPSVLLNAAF